MLRTVCAFLTLSIAACVRPKPRQEASQAQNDPQPVIVASSVSSAPVGVEDPALRRTYGAADMRFNPCAKLEADVVEGKQCPGDIVVFGPYVNVPGNADVKISFDVESPMKLTASSDVVSQVGKIFHAGIDDEAIEPGPRRHLQYRVRVAQPTTALEARITLRGEGRSNFKIFNFSLAVQ